MCQSSWVNLLLVFIELKDCIVLFMVCWHDESTFEMLQCFERSSWMFWMMWSGHWKVIRNQDNPRKLAKHMPNFVVSTVPADGLMPLGITTSAGNMIAKSRYSIWMRLVLEWLTSGILNPLFVYNDGIPQVRCDQYDLTSALLALQEPDWMWVLLVINK